MLLWKTFDLSFGSEHEVKNLTLSWPWSVRYWLWSHGLDGNYRERLNLYHLWKHGPVIGKLNGIEERPHEAQSYIRKEHFIVIETNTLDQAVCVAKTLQYGEGLCSRKGQPAVLVYWLLVFTFSPIGRLKESRGVMLRHGLYKLISVGR